MGHGAYARGSRAISAQIDREIAGKPQRDTHTDNKVDSLLEIVTAQGREIDRQAKMLRKRKALALTLLSEVRFLRRDARDWRKTATKNMRRWQYVSRILRALCTPQQVSEWRKEHGEIKN
jgi:hypothetical protein